MKRKPLCILAAICCCLSLFAQVKYDYFPKKNLTSTGVYYYPEHWSESQWERDFKKIADMGFEYTHFAEFAWAQLEPEKGKYDFAWLDRAIDLADKQNLKVILCTSTATPPIWLVREHPEILIKNENDTRMDHGARQHISGSSAFYREYSLKMIEELGKRYGQDTRIMGWQLDNEPIVRQDFNDETFRRFRSFLKEKYQNEINKLNDAWGTPMWSQWYGNFDQINPPRPSNWGQNPHQMLDWKRFTAHEVATFMDEQYEVLRKYSTPDKWITSNYVPNYEDGHIGQSKLLDFYSYTRYMVYGDPGIGDLGFRIGDPMRIPFANDFFRPFKGLYGVMELQPGQVNWGSVNSRPYPGAVRLWLWSVFAGGSDFVCTYRFRQPLFGDEQFHQAIITTDGVTPSEGGVEFQKFMDEIVQLRKIYHAKKKVPQEYTKRKTALLYNHENGWSISKRPLTYLWNTESHIQKYYKALKSFGAPVDVIYEGKEWSDYPVLIAPAYEMVDDSLINAWKNYAEQGGHLVLTCRTGMKDRYSRLFEMPVSGKIFPLIGSQIEFYDLLPSNRKGMVTMDNKGYEWNVWGDILVPDKDTEIWATYSNEYYAGRPAVIHRKTGKGTITYIGVDSKEGALEKDVLNKLYTQNNIPLLDLPEGIWMEYRDGFGIAVNYSSEIYNFPLPSSAKPVIGDKVIKPADVLVWTF